jgi:outer membrane biosynthesis protein TonB
MKVIKVLSTAILFLLPIAPASAQEKREEEKQPAQKQAQPARPAQQQAKPAAQPAKPAQQPQRAQAAQPARPAVQPTKPAQQPQNAQVPRQAQQQARPAAQPAKPAEQSQRAQAPRPVQQQSKPAQQPQRAQAPQQAPQRTNSVQASAGHPNNGGRIPGDRFRASFGSGHTFHVNRAEFARGSRRFQYGGFWFDMVNPWPVAWLYTDAVYVDYISGGYFLCDPVHPGVLLSINVG